MTLGYLRQSIGHLRVQVERISTFILEKLQPVVEPVGAGPVAT